MNYFSKLNQQKLSDIAPYAIAFMFLIILFSIRYSNSTWMSGITNNYLSVHIVLEFIGIIISFAIFTVGWATYQNARETDILILSIASFAIGWLDLGHTLSFTGMPDFFGPSGPNKAIHFWFASRATGAFAFLYLAMSRPRSTRFRFVQWLILAVALAWVSLCFWAILAHADSMPVFFVQGQGLNNQKIFIEWLIASVSIVAGIMFFVSAEKRQNMSIRWMGCASLLYGMCGYFFTTYRDFDDIYNFSGHCFKAVSYVILYRCVFVECVSRPYERVQHLAREAEASNLSKSRFLANVSHEFRTPLGVISGFVELMINSNKLENPLRDWAQTIGRNSKQLSLLIDDLLDLAKAETEKIQIRMARFDLLVLVNQVKQSLEMQAGSAVVLRVENKIDSLVTLSASESSMMVTTDELRLRQILINIIGNAVKFTAKGEIVITLQKCGANKIEIQVQDSGIGIDSADANKLFQPFSQVSNPTSRRFSGTGLGLALSRKLSELLGGYLNLKWSRPNEGSCFSLAFENRIHEKVTVHMSDTKIKKASTPPAFNELSILVAEDSPDNQLLLKSYLESTHAKVVFADNGQIALDEAMKSHFDLILMDIQMPIMDGFETTAKLRQKGWNGQIVALTAHALQPEKERAMRSGFDNYLIKPIRKEALWSAISYSLNQYHS